MIPVIPWVGSLPQHLGEIQELQSSIMLCDTIQANLAVQSWYKLKIAVRKGLCAIACWACIFCKIRPKEWQLNRAWIYYSLHMLLGSFRYSIAFGMLEAESINHLPRICDEKLRGM